jgi:hypothetical protein
MDVRLKEDGGFYLRADRLVVFVAIEEQGWNDEDDRQTRESRFMCGRVTNGSDVT